MCNLIRGGKGQLGKEAAPNGLFCLLKIEDSCMWSHGVSCRASITSDYREAVA